MWEAFDNSIGQLPIRRIDFDDAQERATHDRVVELAEQIEQCLVVKESGLSVSERSIAARRAEALADRLDEIVLELYGITDDEERVTVLALGESLG